MDLSRIKLGFESFVTKARQWTTQDTAVSNPDGNSKLGSQSSVSNSDRDPLQCDSDHATDNASLPEHLRKSLSLIDEDEREREAEENEVAVKISNEEERGNEVGEDAKSEESIGGIKATENEENVGYDWIGAAKHEKQDEYDWTGADESEKRVEYDWIGTDEHENRGEYGWNGADKHGNRDERSDHGSYHGTSDNNYARKNLFRVRPEVGDCAYYMRRGTCKFGSNCKFNHPVIRKNQVTKEKVKVAKEKVKLREDLPQNLGQTECKVTKENVKERKDLPENPGQTECKVTKEKVKQREDLPGNPGPTECKVTKEKVKERADLPENPGQTECKVTKEKVKVAKEKVKQREDLPENLGQTECKVTKEKVKVAKQKVKKREDLSENLGQTERKVTKEKVKVAKEKVKEREDLPENPGQTESNVIKEKVKIAKEKVKERVDLLEKPGQTEFKVTKEKAKVAKEKVKEREALPENPGQALCKYYLRTGGCKFGNACRYNHSRAKVTVDHQTEELNFLGLPIRPGEKECPYYMHNGSCKYGVNCKFNHPDPTAVGGSDPDSGYGNGGSSTLQSTSQSSVDPWSSPMMINETAPFAQVMFSQAQVVPPKSPEWNDFQAPLYPPERSIHPPPAYVMTDPATETDAYTHHREPQILVMKTEDRKFKMNRKFHHPKSHISKSPPRAPSDMGLRLRPDQKICSQYSRQGICKFGPACRFEHPIQLSSSHQRSFGDSVTVGVDTIAGNEKGNANGTLP